MRFFVPVFLVLVMSGCGSVQRAFQSPESRASAEERALVEEERTRLLTQALRTEVALWIGTPHVLGGTDSSGVDCSALVQRIYADALAVSTPRTTSQLMEEGARVRRSKLAVGDLVFFEPGKKTDHVGIYLDQNEFAHASSSRGVMISNFSDPYWKGVYRTARRLLTEEDLEQLVLHLKTQRQLTEELIPAR